MKKRQIAIITITPVCHSPVVIRDVVIKLESNFLMDYDEDGYPSDVFVSMEDLFHTQSQVDKFIKTMEGATYRLKQ